MLSLLVKLNSCFPAACIVLRHVCHTAAEPRQKMYEINLKTIKKTFEYISSCGYTQFIRNKTYRTIMSISNAIMKT